jgi:DNA-binding transcriptional regulator YhcF (GntR family)
MSADQAKKTLHSINSSTPLYMRYGVEVVLTDTLDSPGYAYLRIADAIAARIQAGQITGRLPPERELACEYEVSYQTLRRAIDLLRERGLIVTCSGRGSFAAAPPSFLVSEHDLNTIALMTAQPADAVTFSDLSRNPRVVAERARRLGRLRVTHRDASDFFLITATQEEERDENLITASRMFAALARSPAGARAVADAMTDVFPWASHLSKVECSEFAAELIAALSDAAELAIDGNAREVIAGWRATARVKADPSLHAQALSPTVGDYGAVEVLG